MTDLRKHKRKPRRKPMAVTRAICLRLLRRAGASVSAHDARVLRNYEIEEWMEQKLQRRWAVAEPCPFDGECGSYREFAADRSQFDTRLLPPHATTTRRSR